MEPRSYDLIVLAFAAVIFLGCIVSPPSLMDDVDAANAEIARNMLESGDWVTARLNGVPYLEKPPLHSWLIAISYAVFGVRDWAARVPLALSAVALCLLTARFSAWAFGATAGLYAGLSLATCVGLFLFTRVLIADAILALAVTLSLWSFLRALDEDEPHPRRWAFLMVAGLGAGFLAKALMGLVAPLGAGLLYLLCTRRLFLRSTWQRLRPFSGALVVLAMAAPWVVWATLRNPPYFDFTLRSEPGQYHGFLWLFFINEHLLRFLNLRHPRDYDTVPRLWFWLLHLVWLFPWSVFFAATTRLGYKPVDRAGRARLLALCWIGFLLAFFTFSSTQEYYSLPCYPALALLLGSAMAAGGPWIRGGLRAASVIAGLAAVAVFLILFQVRAVPAVGDISSALTHNPEAYRLSLGHMSDLTLNSFAYLRKPLAMAGLALLVGALGTWLCHDRRAFFALALMMALFAHAARLALVVFDPYLSSRPLAEALERAPAGRLMVYGEFYPLSSVFYYSRRHGLLVNGRFNDLEYGSYAPGAPEVFIGDAEFQRLWSSPGRSYLVVAQSDLPRVEQLLGRSSLHTVAASGRKFLFTSQAPARGTK